MVLFKRKNAAQALLMADRTGQSLGCTESRELVDPGAGRGMAWHIPSSWREGACTQTHSLILFPVPHKLFCSHMGWVSLLMALCSWHRSAVCPQQHQSQLVFILLPFPVPCTSAFFFLVAFHYQLWQPCLGRVLCCRWGRMGASCALLFLQARVAPVLSALGLWAGCFSLGFWHGPSRQHASWLVPAPLQLWLFSEHTRGFLYYGKD